MWRGHRKGRRTKEEKELKRQAASISQSVEPAHTLANQAYMLLQLSTVRYSCFITQIFRYNIYYKWHCFAFIGMSYK